MTTGGRQWLMILLVVLALAPGLCSVVFTPIGIAMMFGRDSLGESVGGLMLVSSAAGWAVVALLVFFIRRLRRAPVTEPPPKDGPVP